MKHLFLATALVSATCLAQVGASASMIPTASRPAVAWKYTRIGDLDGVRALTRLSDRLIRGAQPDGIIGIKSLKTLGVRNILSVEEPDLKEIEAAKEAGIEIKNVATEYSGFPKPIIDSLVAAYRDLEGTTYVHCHHGKHRGGSAVAIFRMTFEGFSSEEAIAEMFELGCSPRYKGLYETISKYRPNPATSHRPVKAKDGLVNLVEITPQLFRATGGVDETSLRSFKELGITRVVLVNGTVETAAKIRAASLDCAPLTMPTTLSAMDLSAARSVIDSTLTGKTLLLASGLEPSSAALAGWRVLRSKWTLDEAAQEVEAIMGEAGSPLAATLRRTILPK